MTIIIKDVTAYTCKENNRRYVHILYGLSKQDTIIIRINTKNNIETKENNDTPNVISFLLEVALLIRASNVVLESFTRDHLFATLTISKQP